MEQAGKMIYLVANWKSHKTLEESLIWLEGMKTAEIKDNYKIIVCPPFPYIKPMHDKVTDSQLNLSLGVQDISPFPFGAYTGAVASDMVKDWVTYAIVGHSEQRRYFHETDQEVANKVREALAVGLTPIVCVDEPYLESQITALKGANVDQLIFAYEPLAAIGSGHPDTPEHAQNVAERIQAQLKAKVPVLYGGSVTPENIKPYLLMPNISGALVGGASLDSETWKAMMV